MGYYISQKDYDKIINYAKAAYDTMSSEIGGMSVCYKDKEGDWIVTDPVIIKQEVTGGTCDLDKEELAHYYCKAAKKHAKKEFRFCWWHSHHTMGVFWSSTDIKGINEYSDGDLSFALVVNLKRENLFRASVWNPVVMHEDTELQIMSRKVKSIVPKKILEEVEELCNHTTHQSIWKGSKNMKQPSLWDNEIDLYNNGFHQYGYGNYAESQINYGSTTNRALPEGQMHKFCYDKIVYWIDSIIEGTLTYKEYEKEMESANDDLIKLKAPFTFVKIGKEEIDEELFMEDPNMWIAPVIYETEDNEEILNATSSKKQV